MTDYAVIQAMIRMGGSFMQAIGEASMRADAINLAKLKGAFPDEWQEYTTHAQALADAGRGPK